MFTRLPSPEAIRCGRNALVPFHHAQKSTFMIRSMSDERHLRNVPVKAMPALLITR